MPAPKDNAVRVIARLPRRAQFLLIADGINAFGAGLVLPFLLIYLSQVRHVSIQVAAVALAVSAGCSFASGLAWGSLLDRYSHRVVMPSAMLLAAIGTALYAVADAAWSALAVSVLVGVAAGGVVGDDGPAGITLGDLYPGNAYREVQRRARMLREQGVLLAICSKNSPEVVGRVLAEHPAMVLRAGDFVAQAVNWSPKDENPRELAQALNLGLDSMVFFDDSAFECELVRGRLPKVRVVRADGDPADIAARLLGARLFTALQLTETDLERSERYRSDAQRQTSLRETGSTEDFLRGLGLRVRVREAGPCAVPRVHQLLHRTSQFSTTGLRWTESQISAALDAADRKVLVFDVTDRFGSENTVGAVLLSTGQRRWTIDNFVMSCRVFSRGIEFAVLAHVAGEAAGSGAAELAGPFAPTPRNGAAAGLCPAAGFTPPGAGQAGEAGQEYLLALRPLPDLAPEWIHLESEASHG